MKQFKTSAIVNLTAGNLELDKDQHRRRRHLVTANGDGTFAIVKSVQFKAGEEFGFDGEISNTLAADVTPLTPKEAKALKKRLAPEKKKADAEAADKAEADRVEAATAAAELAVAHEKQAADDPPADDPDPADDPAPASDPADDPDPAD